MPFFKQPVSFPLNFALPFSFMTHNSSVNFKLTHLLLWRKGCYQSPNFECFFSSALVNDAKIDKELTCRFKIDMRNLTNFDASTQKSQKFAL